MKISLPSFINREVPIDTTIWLHCMPIRIVEGRREKWEERGKGGKGRERKEERENRRNRTDSNWKSDSLLMRRSNSTDTLENTLAVSYTTKQTFTIWTSYLIPRNYLMKMKIFIYTKVCEYL